MRKQKWNGDGNNGASEKNEQIKKMQETERMASQICIPS